MKRLKGLTTRFGGVFAAFALAVGVISAQPAMCVIIFHQPKVPEGMSKFLKNKQ